jgi:hypothetical protein
MQRVLINVGGYRGECLDVDRLVKDVEDAAQATGWTSIPITPPGHSLPAFERLVRPPAWNVYISTGIHGDEPAGPLAALELLKENDWPENVNLWLAACLNPAGLRLNRREDENGVDLNRDYRTPKSEVVRAHVAWLEQRPRFHLSLCLHEDWESHGFYLYELNPDRRPSHAEAIIQQVKEVCPVDLSPVIEGRDASGGIICANPDLLKRPDWPEAFHLIHHKTRMSYTLESPSDFPLTTRVQALVTGVRAVMEELRRNPTPPALER